MLLKNLSSPPSATPFLFLLGLFLFSDPTYANCKVKASQTIPSGSITISASADTPPGTVLSTINFPPNPSAEYADCDESGSTLRYIAYDGHCVIFENACYQVLRDSNGRAITSVGIRVIDARGNIYHGGSTKEEKLVPNSKPRFDELGPFSIQLIKLPGKLQTITSANAQALKITVSQDGKSYPILTYTLAPISLIITSPLCILTYNPIVKLSTVAINELQPNGPPTPFTLSFSQCPKGQVKLTIKNTNATLEKEGILPNQSAGGATDIGVQILNEQGQAIALNKENVVGNQTDFSRTFSARIRKIGNKASVGQVDASAELLITYE